MRNFIAQVYLDDMKCSYKYRKRMQTKVTLLIFFSTDTSFLQSKYNSISHILIYHPLEHSALEHS